MDKFDPFDSATWRNDPDDFTVPPHEMEAKAQELSERAYKERIVVDKTHTISQGDADMRQVGQGQQALSDALRVLDDAEAALSLTDEEIADELHRRDPVWWEAIQEARRTMRKHLDEGTGSDGLA